MRLRGEGRAGGGGGEGNVICASLALLYMMIGRRPCIHLVIPTLSLTLARPHDRHHCAPVDGGAGVWGWMEVQAVG